MPEIKDTPRSDAVVHLVQNAVTLIMNVSPASGKEGYSIVANHRIKSLADAIRNLDSTLRQTLSNDGKVS